MKIVELNGYGRFFYVQICGGWADTLTRCSQLINDNLEADFVDLNCGCPIDLVYKKVKGRF